MEGKFWKNIKCSSHCYLMLDSMPWEAQNRVSYKLEKVWSENSKKFQVFFPPRPSNRIIIVNIRALGSIESRFLWYFCSLESRFSLFKSRCTRRVRRKQSEKNSTCFPYWDLSMEFYFNVEFRVLGGPKSRISLIQKCENHVLPVINVVSVEGWEWQILKKIAEIPLSRI